jgi:hypothetical protein
MWQGIRQLDRILRGEATQPTILRSGDVDVSIASLVPALVVLGALYGFFLSWFGLFNRESLEYRFVVSAVLKTPALFGLTLLVTFPSLYVFNALVGSRLSVVALLRLLLATLGVTLSVLASFGPIVAFFSATTSSYPFMALLNVTLFAVSGILGLSFLLQTLHRLTSAELQPPQVVDENAAAAGPLDRVNDRLVGREVKTVFYCWVVAFGLVGAQMSWVLRPFIGNPAEPFEWFRPRQSHFFEAVGQALRQLLS